MRLSSAVIGVGLLLMGFAGFWQLGLVPGSRPTLPAPVALQSAAPPPPTIVLRPSTPATPSTPTPVPRPTVVRDTPIPVAHVAPTVEVQTVLATAPFPARPLVPADRDDRVDYVKLPDPGYAVRLAIPSIKLDSQVKQGGIVTDTHGNLVWQTLPFVAVHYGDVTALVGAMGNAVIAGHVVTLSEGNVFRNLYKVNMGDTIDVWDDHDREHQFQVVDVKLVSPDDLSPMAQTRDPTLTLITCGGTFDPIKREFADRLIVVAKPLLVAADNNP